MPAGWLYEWWLLWNDEPWGELRADLRHWAQVCMSLGSTEVKLEWPYVEPGWTIEEIQDEMDRLERELADGDRRENLDRH